MNKFFKHLKKQFRKNSDLLFFDEVKFLQAYFQVVALHKDMPLDYFIFPKPIKSQTIYRVAYFRDLFQSEKLRVAYLEWTSKHFWPNYRRSIRGKILRLLSPWNAKIENDSENKAEVLKKMAANFKTLHLRSLPWTKSQASCAFKRLNEILFSQLNES